ncbi:MAG: hypothetical protein GXW85_04895 [Clostridia bacterium]|nr:hypothetical protein [Clostridia bacterium]
MAVIANWKISTRDKEGNLKTYFAGDLVEELSNQEEMQLLKQGAATKILVGDNKKNKNQKKDGE